MGAPLFMDRGSDGKLQEVGQVSVSLQTASGDFQTTKLNGFEVFARFGSAIAPLGDLDQDGFNGKARPPSWGGCEWERRRPRLNAKVPFPLGTRADVSKTGSHALLLMQPEQGVG